MRTESQIRILIKKDLRWIVGVILVVAAVLGIRVVAIERYTVSSPSMQPTLYGAKTRGDTVFANKLSGAPDRWDIVLFRKEGEDKPLIKRVVGLPGDSVEVDRGEIRVGGSFPPRTRSEQDGILVPLFQSRGLDQRGFERFFRWEGGELTAEGDSWVLRPQPGECLELASRFEIKDGILDPDGIYLEGLNVVRDLEIDLRITPGEGEGQLSLGLEIEGNPRWVRFPIGRPTGVQADSSDGRATLTIGDRQPQGLDGVPTLSPGAPVRLRVEHIDGVVTVRFGPEVVASVPVNPSRAMPEGFGNRIRIQLEGCSAVVEELSVRRDLYITNQGRFGIGRPFTVPEGHYFLLGDYSPNSRDSRDFGAVPEEDLIGSAFMILWPPGRIRGL